MEGTEGCEQSEKEMFIMFLEWLRIVAYANGQELVIVWTIINRYVIYKCYYMTSYITNDPQIIIQCFVNILCMCEERVSGEKGRRRGRGEVIEWKDKWIKSHEDDIEKYVNKHYRQ